MIQAKLADKLGIKEKYISAAENGKPISPRIAESIAQALGKPTPSLFKSFIRVAKSEVMSQDLTGGEDSNGVQISCKEQKQNLPSSIKFLLKWTEANKIIENAKRSILIVDSFFSEYCNLDILVGKALENGATNLEVSVYMMSPTKDFGAQRVKEKQAFTNNYPDLKDVLERKISASERDAYAKKFQEFKNEIRDHLEKYTIKYPVNVKIYEYPSMPSIRFIVVDGIYMIAGWFPLFDQNPGFPCIFMEKTNLEGTDSEVFAKLETQVKHIKAISNRIPLERKNRKNTKVRRGGTV